MEELCPRALYLNYANPMGANCFALGKAAELEADGPKTLEQVGLLIGVTKERVRQIQNRALEKLRSKLQDDFLAA